MKTSLTLCHRPNSPWPMWSCDHLPGTRTAISKISPKTNLGWGNFSPIQRFLCLTCHVTYIKNTPNSAPSVATNELKIDQLKWKKKCEKFFLTRVHYFRYMENLSNVL